ncbi:nitrogenase-stabilizing/protective protein NifW [Oceanobacter mangrovi]|uniref:nitrogenase-stabilizing/protective protein NifW n=1 Tax=Oceanobacter mangrovi TaxID=2862510 RepID=UPI001C8D4A4D|nr:nitrogenase-stabilizing/protective protein NifW [Oceanobacter mangrovi]
MTEDLTLDEALDELVSAEDFLEYFAIPFDAAVVHVNRLHIMQRFHDYLSQSGDSLAEYEDNEESLKSVYQALLTRAYQDFVESDALTEKVFKVFKMHEPQTTFVPLESLL